MAEYSQKQACRQGSGQKVTVRHDGEKQQSLAIMGTSSTGAGRDHRCKGIFVIQDDSASLVVFCQNRKDSLWAEDSKSAEIATVAKSVRVCIKS